MSGRYTLFDSDRRLGQAAAPDRERRRAGLGLRRRNRSGKHDHLEFIFTDGSRAVYTDPRRFGIIDLFPAEDEAGHKLLASLGPEPFDPWDAQALADRLKVER